VHSTPIFPAASVADLDLTDVGRDPLRYTLRQLASNSPPYGAVNPTITVARPISRATPFLRRGKHPRARIGEGGRHFRLHGSRHLGRRRSDWPKSCPEGGGPAGARSTPFCDQACRHESTARVRASLPGLGEARPWISGRANQILARLLSPHIGETLMRGFSRPRTLTLVEESGRIRHSSS
jgi:hypothetical protein